MNAIPKTVVQPAERAEASAPAALCSRAVEGTALDAAGNRSEVAWQLPEEVAVALQINSAPYTVMMATPANLTDFGIGFALAEGVVQKRSDIRGVLAMPVENGFAVDIAVEESALEAGRMVRRSIEGRSGCGLCGVENIADVVRVTQPVPHRVIPDPAAILKAAHALPALQPMNRLNRTVHGAAWASLSGEILIVREDVGRHNALDKLIGALRTRGTDPQSGFVVVTSRASFEMVHKAAMLGTSLLVTVSGATGLAVRMAHEANLTLCGFSRGESHVVYTHAWRVVA
jgi:FdhD protein